jgi:hypothetical protein
MLRICCFLIAKEREPCSVFYFRGTGVGIALDGNGGFERRYLLAKR